MRDLETGAGNYLVWRRLWPGVAQQAAGRAGKPMEVEQDPGEMQSAHIGRLVDRRLQYLVVGPELGTVREQRLVGHR